MAGKSSPMFAWSQTDLSVLGSQVFVQALRDSCDTTYTSVFCKEPVDGFVNELLHAISFDCVTLQENESNTKIIHFAFLTYFTVEVGRSVSSNFEDKKCNEKERTLC